MITFRETIKSAAIAAIATVLTGVVTILQAGGAFTWESIKPALIAGAITLLSALIQFFRTDTVASATKDIQENLKPSEKMEVTKENALIKPA